MTEVRFDGQVVIVTGAGRGMGRAHALLLAERGATVVVNDVGSGMHGSGSDTGPADDVVAEIQTRGGNAIANFDDVSTSRGCDALVAAAVSEFGRVDAVLHNAGVFTFTPLAQIHDGTWDHIRSVSLDASLFLTRAAWPHFVAQGGGSVLYISSGAGLYGSPTLAHYGAAKTGMMGLARVAAHEGASANIRANVLAVGAHTRMTAHMLKDSPNLEKFWENYYRPELVSAAAAWLVHPDCTANGRFYEAMGSRVARFDYVESRGLCHLDLTVDDVRDHFAEIDEFGDLGSSHVFEDQVAYGEFLMKLHIEMGATPPEPDAVMPQQV
ncbi:SDR family NAD(P)-dependent oxidoreductase [Mycobacterium paraseoulense]|uniref:Short-chain dehydrogenase n=1 Tax=Mycobacterium paraseoulense TaxID=590652 RepID=A0A1X0IG26_9MYCO|nr:SDR family NAD(P)-dependent oxidoreductase [Mycobacterium paraseoulense]MCV7393795.1 SDR family NAD(P)-dependent oxidoreductase [Mycobacterium paraseoulense]ORB45468.1 hypothetical protein BST39_04450 [Mycobacterium paraseoulense]BBZ70588.1 short-chain dehydrogenase [Mycobacterium paraseoulense]